MGVGDFFSGVAPAVLSGGTRRCRAVVVKVHPIGDYWKLEQKERNKKL